MKTLKKLFSVSAIVALLGTLMPINAFAANYSDELQEAYAYALSNGITTMKTIDAADMYGSLTRVAMAKMIANYATTVLGLEPDTSAKCTFSDVTAALDAQYDNGVTKACQLGLMGQNITAFRPNDLVTRAEFGTTLSRALNHDSDDLEAMNAANPYYKDHLNFLKAEGIMNQIDNPSMTEVRGYVMLMMMRADKGYTPNEKCSLEEMVACALAEDTDACLAACTGNEGEETPANPGYAKVSTKAASTQTVALNAVEKKIGTVTLTAGENETTVTSLEITKAGLGDPTDILSIQLMKNGEYVSNAASLTSKKTATLRFSPKLVIKAGKSETFDVVVSLDGTKANGQHDFSVTAVTVANGSFGGTPAKLGSLVTTNYTVGSVKATEGGDYNLNAGDENVEFASVTLKPEVEAIISSVTLTSKQDELNKAFSNVKAYIDDEIVGKVTVNDETITIEGLKETVKANKTLDIVLKGDVTYVGENTTKVFYVDSNHVNAVETNTDERMSSTKSNDFDVVIAGVDLTLKNLVKKTQKVAPGTDDVVLMDLELSAGADLEVTEYYVKFPSTFDFTEYEDEKVTLYVDGINYDITSTDLVSDVYTLSSKKDYFAISAGDKISIQVLGTAEDSAVTDVDKITFGINEVKNTETNKTISGTPLIDEEGHKTTYAAGALTVKNTKKGSENLIEEGATSNVLSFSVKASNEKVTLKKITTTIDVADAADLDSVEKIALYKSGSSSAIATVDNDDFDIVSTQATVEFSISQAINAEATENYIVKATLSDGTVTALGKDFTFAVSDIEYRAASASSNGHETPSTLSEKYTMASTQPTFTLSKNGNEITVEITNDSEYDLIDQDGTAGIKFTLKVIGVFVDGSDLLASAINSNTWTVKDDSDHEIAGATATYSSNVLTVTLPATYSISSNDSETLIVEIDEKTTIESNYYNVSEKSIDFRYSDGTDNSNLIQATY